MTRTMERCLKGNGGAEFLQFSKARITRTPFPRGGFIYRTTDSGTGESLYLGSDPVAARAAATSRNMAAE